MNQTKNKKEPGDISQEPEMIELEHMIEASEPDGDLAAGYARSINQQGKDQPR